VKGWMKNSAMRLQSLDFNGQSFSPVSLALLAHFLPKCTALTEVVSNCTFFFFVWTRIRFEEEISVSSV
jgi:hypothetical protein